MPVVGNGLLYETNHFCWHEFVQTSVKQFQRNHLVKKNVKVMGHLWYAIGMDENISQLSSQVCVKFVAITIICS